MIIHSKKLAEFRNSITKTTLYQTTHFIVEQTLFLLQILCRFSLHEQTDNPFGLNLF